jgi:predicted O-methyltransferase YrrM
MNDFRQHIKQTIVRVLSHILPAKMMFEESFFHLWEDKGYHISPVHFYEPVPDTRDFPPDIFERESALAGIEMNETEQLNLLNTYHSRYKDEYSKFEYGSTSGNDAFFFGNSAFETVDAEMLYCMVRHFKPKHIIEIGSGFSTLITAKAIRQNIIENPDYHCEFICIEPYPQEWLGKIAEVARIIQSRVEGLQIDVFKTLEQNDILFIDSTHVVKIYNDVCFEYLDVLPILNKGVVVHIHDVLLPRQYCRSWYESKLFWNEQYLLQAFMAFNTSFKVLWAGYFMHLRHSKELAKAFPSYLKFKDSKEMKRQLKGHKSFWIQRVS